MSRRVTSMSSANDVSVNQTRSVLLNILNDYSGTVIFATNFITNFDPAFMRRIHFHVKFDLPNEALREQLWKRYVPSTMPNSLDIKKISKDYDNISGSNISTAVLNAALKAASLDRNDVPHEFFCEAIENVIKSRQDNHGINDEEKVTRRIVSEDYALSRINKEKGVTSND